MLNSKTAWQKLLFLLLVLLANGCSNIKGPYTPNKVLTPVANAKISIPAFASKPGTTYAYLEEVYYFTDLGDDAWLTAYFVDPNTKTSVAKMRMSLYALGVTPNENPRKVNIVWADEKTGFTCTPAPDSFPKDMIASIGAYQTCVQWGVGKHQMLIYSQLPLPETLRLVNSLEEIK